MIWVAPTAVIAGDVTVGDESSLWHHTVLRGDEDAIVVGKQSNLQDGCVVHEDRGTPTRIGDRVTVGHGAVIHGCTLEDEVTVGMGAIVTSGARVGTQSFIAAGAVIPEGMAIPARSIALGVPAKVKPASAEHLARIDNGWRTYLALARAQLPAWPAMQGDAEHRVALGKGR
ncbi:MAG TPA: gamma carbonic anhydrase family protein [Candidatus Thermoplasmatota archaeon]|jgi:carbonic anhydrase/acetyltransferase-like protein (isoleucine patch superfamily)|nr:gamma carbonic anhydrase family protein [Candidatus Thermoplasmatota archaeon]